MFLTLLQTAGNWNRKFWYIFSEKFIFIIPWKSLSPERLRPLSPPAFIIQFKYLETERKFEVQIQVPTVENSTSPSFLHISNAMSQIISYAFRENILPTIVHNYIQLINITSFTCILHFKRKDSVSSHGD